MLPPLAPRGHIAPENRRPYAIFSSLPAAGMRFSRLAHNFAQLLQVIGVMVQTHNEAPDGVERAESRIRRVGDVEVRLVGPGVEHSLAHPAAFLETLARLGNSQD